MDIEEIHERLVNGDFEDWSLNWHNPKESSDIEFTVDGHNIVLVDSSYWSLNEDEGEGVYPFKSLRVDDEEYEWEEVVGQGFRRGPGECAAITLPVVPSIPT